MKPLKEYTLTRESPYLGHIDPVTKNKLKVGDRVVEGNCRHILLRESWDYLGGQCPFCDTGNTGPVKTPTAQPSQNSTRSALFALPFIGVCAVLAVLAIIISAIIQITPFTTVTPTQPKSSPVIVVVTATTGHTENRTSSEVPEIASATPHTQPSATNSPTPKIENVRFCDRPCDENGAVELTHFPQGTTDIYFSWDFSGMERGVTYSREWRYGSQRWVLYQCTWNGPESGTFSKALYEHGGGLRSGRWTLVVMVKNEVLFTSSVEVDGNNSYWAPFASNPDCPDW